MNVSSVKSLFLLCVLLFSTSACAQNSRCETDNDALQAMPKSLLSIERSDGSRFDVKTKTATNNTTRAAGFQRVCESTIKAEPILFVFPAPLKPRFHMNNVVAPIDIAFIDDQGKIESIQAMKPYVIVSTKRPLYGPSRPIIWALEGHQGFYDQHNIKVGDTVSMRALDSE